MSDITLNQIPAILDMTDLARDEIVPCFLGAPGIGKTQSVYQWAKKHGREVVEIILSQCLPTEISGITMPDNEKKSMEVFDHARLSNLKDGDILFLDELLEAPPMVLSACLTLIQERRLVSGKKLPDIMIVAAANPLASPTLVKQSIRERFMFFNVDFGLVNWLDYVDDVLGVTPHIKMDELFAASDDWNDTTPRTVMKLLSLGSKIDFCDKYDVDRFKLFLRGTIGEQKILCDKIIKCFLNKSINKKTADTVMDHCKGVDGIDLDKIHTMNIDELMDLIESLPIDVKECIEKDLSAVDLGSLGCD